LIDPEGRNLIFILSTPRAGSTLLAALLGSHSRVLCPPEPWLLLSLNAIRSNDVVVISHYDHELARKALHELADDELFCQAANAFAATIYNSLLDQADKQVFVDKTPRYYHILPWLETMFPLALKIWIKRNPLDVVASRKSRGFTIEESVGEVVSPYSFDTTISFALLASYFEAGTPTQYAIRYEDLVQDPVTHVKAICEFVGLPFEEGMLDYGANRGLMDTYANATMGDERVLEHVRPHTRSIGRWRDLLTPGEIRKVLQTLGRNLFVRLGYGDLVEEVAARAGLNPAEIDEKGKLDQLFERYNSFVDGGLLVPGGFQYTTVARRNAQLQDRNAQLQDRNAQLQDRNAQLQDRNAQLQDRNAQLQAEIGQQLAQLSQLRNSWGWKITAPLRKALEILRR
jgi:protein-tyrosine sulfotransferase